MEASAPLLLVVDVGNTCMVFGLYQGTDLAGRWQLSSERKMTGDELALNLRGLTAAPPIRGILAASVVPHLDGVLADACRQVFGISPVFVGAAEVRTGLAVD